MRASEDKDYLAEREAMIETIAAYAFFSADLTDRQALDERVMVTLARVPRHVYVPQEVRHLAYADSPLPIGHGKTISQPFIVALMTDLLDLQESDRVLEVGTGLGYQAAVLAELVDQVYSIEILQELGNGAEERVYVAFQRAWQDDPEDRARIGVYRPANDSWSFLFYPLEAPQSAAGGWVGLSEIVALGDGKLAVLERDNQSGPAAAIKRVYVVDVTGVAPAFGWSAPPDLRKTLAFDLLPALAAAAGWIPDKPEGLTVAADGAVFVVTDNDGVDGATGETQLLRIGRAAELFAGS